MQRKTLLTLLVMFALIEALVFGVLVGATAGWWVGVLVAMAAASLPAVLLGPLVGLFLRAFGWGRLAAAFPARPTPSGTDGLMMPTLVLGGLPMNNAVEWHADDDYLHLTPLIVTPGLAPPISIPWAAVRFIDSLDNSPGKGGMVAIEAGGVKMKVSKASVEKELAIRRAIASAPADNPDASEPAA